MNPLFSERQRRRMNPVLDPAEPALVGEQTQFSQNLLPWLVQKINAGGHAQRVYEGTADAGDVGGALGLAGAAMTGGIGGVGGAPGMALGAGPIRRGGEPGKTFWTDLSTSKLKTPLEDMRATHEPIEGALLPRKTISPEDLQGSIITPAVGDRTAAGKTLTSIGEKPLAYPVHLEGGPDFMRAQAAQSADKSAWASDTPVISSIAKQTRELAKEGKPINFVYSSMGGRSGDYSTMMTDALMAQLPGSKIASASQAAFDAQMRKITPDWPGLKDVDAARDALFANGEMRKAFTALMEKGPWQNAGFPDVAATRHAITTPELVNQPTGMSGYAISRLNPEAPVITNPLFKHTTYKTHLGGEGYLGGLEKEVPRNIMFPDFYKRRRELGTPEGSDDRAFSLSRVHQHADQQWLDQVMNYLRGRQ